MLVCAERTARPAPGETAVQRTAEATERLMRRALGCALSDGRVRPEYPNLPTTRGSAVV